MNKSRLLIRKIFIFFIFLALTPLHTHAAKTIPDQIEPSKLHKIFIEKNTPQFEEIVRSIKAAKKIDYPNSVLLIIDDNELKRIPNNIKNKTRINDKFNTLRIRNRRIDTTRDIPSVNEKYRQKPSSKKKMSIIQFAGPVKPEWYDILKKQDEIEIISYIRHNAYIVSADPASLKEIVSNNKISPYIQWTGPFHPAYKRDEKFSRKDVLKKFYNNNSNAPIQIIIQIHKHKNIEASLKRIEALTGKFINTWTLGNIINVQVKTTRKIVETLLHLPDVFFIELYIPPTTGAERLGLIISNQYSSGTHPTTNSSDYLDWITQQLEPSVGAGVSDFNFILDITDHPIDDGTETFGATADTIHKVFKNTANTDTRVLYQQSHNAAAPSQDKSGHGTFAASVAAGYPIDGSTVNNHTNNYRHGLGIAPFAKLGSTQYFSMLNNRDACDGGGACSASCAADATCTSTCLATPYECALGNPTTLRERMRTAYNDTAGGTIGTRISNNSWGTGIGDNTYSSISQIFDAMVRDVDDLTAGEQPMLFVFLSGNSGASGLWGYGSTAKNTITVGGSATDNQRTPDSTDGCGYLNAAATGIENMYPASSVGPVDTGIVKPDLVAPAMRIHAAVTEDADYPAMGKGICEAGDPPVVPPTHPDGEYPLGHVLYSQSTGTSFAAPAVAGAAANLRHWFTELKSISDPKPSLIKAWLMNTAHYMTATAGTLPSSEQGMGRLDMQRSLDTAPRILRNETIDLTAAATYSVSGKVTDSAQPLNVTLAWTDAVPSTIDGGLINDLNLNLSLNGTDFYCGNNYTNANSNNHVSMVACTLDSENNVESISIPASSLTAGDTFSLTVTAATIPPGALETGGMNTDQDFSLVIYNGDLTTINTGMTVQEASGSNTISTAMLSSAIPSDRAANNIVYTLETVSTAGIGTLRNGATVLAANDSFTQQDLLDSNINFTPASTDGTDALFTFTVSDGAGVINAPVQSFDISINTPSVPAGIFIGSVTEDGSLTAMGTITITDADTGDTPNFPDTAASGIFGDFTLTSGDWTYTLRNADANVQGLDSGDVNVPDAFTVPASDGTMHTVTINVNGADDIPTATDVMTCAFGDTPIAISLSGADADMDVLTITNITAPLVGTLRETVDPLSAIIAGSLANGTVIYYHPPLISPPGSFIAPSPQPSFTFDVDDADSDTINATGTVNINVTLTCREPVDLALVLDFSGSMNQMLGTTTRVQEMQDSVRLFVDTWRMNQPAPEDGNDNIGLVTYNSTSQTVIPDLLPLESAVGDDADEVLTEMCNPDPMDITNCLRNGGGATAMGLGLLDGYNMLSASPNANRFIVLLTDGMQNISPLVNNGGGSFDFNPDNGITNSNFNDNNITVHTLGIGSAIGSTFLDTLENISDSTLGGVTHNTDNATDALPDMWQNTLVESLDANSLEMVGHDSGTFTMADQRTGKKHSYHLNKSARKATFVLYWKGDRRKDALQIALRHKPSGIFIPASTNGLRANDNNFYSIRHMDFPITLPDGTKLTGEGEWELFINGKLNVDSVDYQTWVMAEDDAVKYDFTVPKRTWTVGELVSFISSITDKKGKSIIKKVIEAKVDISAPSIGLGTFVATNKVKSVRQIKTNAVTTSANNLSTIDNQIKALKLDPDSFNNAANKKLLLLLRDPDLQNKLARKVTTLNLKPTPTGNAIAKFDKTRIPGSYTVNISVKAIGIDDSIIQRTRRFSMRIAMDSIDRKNSVIDIQHKRTGKANLQVTITPIDKYKNYLGPGLSDKLVFNAKNIEQVGPLIDNLDGSYTQNFVSNSLFGNTIRLKVLDTELVIETGIDPYIYWFIIFILLIMIGYWLYRQSQK